MHAPPCDAPTLDCLKSSGRELLCVVRSASPCLVVCLAAVCFVCLAVCLAGAGSVGSGGSMGSWLAVGGTGTRRLGSPYVIFVPSLPFF